MTKETPRMPMPRNVDCSRRSVLQAAAGTALAGSLIGHAASAATKPGAEPPQAGDVLVYAHGDHKGQPIKPDDLPLGGPQVEAYPMDPASKTIRNGSRLNEIAVVRLDPKSLSDETRAHAVDGVVAYSSFCTHQGCPVSMWDSDAKVMVCSCHASQYDPAENADVVGGPAERRLAALPLESDDGALAVAGPFIGSVGIAR